MKLDKHVFKFKTVTLIPSKLTSGTFTQKKRLKIVDMIGIVKPS